jgi:hypothetical protein
MLQCCVLLHYLVQSIMGRGNTVECGCGMRPDRSEPPAWSNKSRSFFFSTLGWNRKQKHITPPAARPTAAAPPVKQPNTEVACVSGRSSPIASHMKAPGSQTSGHGGGRAESEPHATPHRLTATDVRGRTGPVPAN